MRSTVSSAPRSSDLPRLESPSSTLPMLESRSADNHNLPATGAQPSSSQARRGAHQAAHTLFSLRERALFKEKVNAWVEQSTDVNKNRVTAAQKLITAHKWSLPTVILSNHNLKDVPDCFLDLKMVKQLNLNNNQLTVLPESLGGLERLEQLDVSNNQLTQLPGSLGDLARLKFVDASNNKLSTLPKSFFEMKVPQREIIVKGNSLTCLPEYDSDSILLEAKWRYDVKRPAAQIVDLLESCSALKASIHFDDNWCGRNREDNASDISSNLSPRSSIEGTQDVPLWKLERFRERDEVGISDKVAKTSLTQGLLNIETIFEYLRFGSLKIDDVIGNLHLDAIILTKVASEGHNHG